VNRQDVVKQVLLRSECIRCKNDELNEVFIPNLCCIAAKVSQLQETNTWQVISADTTVMKQMPTRKTDYEINFYTHQFLHTVYCIGMSDANHKKIYVHE
jgi:hypothetical protein